MTCYLLPVIVLKLSTESSHCWLPTRNMYPQKGEKLDTNKAASVARGQMKDGREVHRIRCPNADAYYAHELGRFHRRQDRCFCK